MRTFFVMLVFSALMVSLAHPAHAAERTVSLALEKMTCPSCNYIVKGALMKVDGVLEATVSFKNKTARVTFDDTKTGVAKLVEATTQGGFPSRLMAEEERHE